MRSRPDLFRKITLALGILLLVGACSKKGADQPRPSTAADILTFSIRPGHDTVNLISYNHSISVHLSDTVRNSTQAATFTLSPGATVTVNNVAQTSGITTNDFGKDVVYMVTAADQVTKTSWTVQAMNNDYSVNWGLGHFIYSAQSNDRNYEWYIDQSLTGPVSGYNCGPASVTMASKWADASFSHTAEEARNVYYNAGGWWYTSDIDNYLDIYSIPHVTIGLSADSVLSSQILAHQIDNGQIVICCIDMNFVRSSANAAFRVDKFYVTTPGWGHFFVVKGYQKIDGQIYFQIYDPYSYGVKNSDNSLKGKDRFYRYADVAAATSSWWNYAIVVGKKGLPLSTDAIRHAIDPASIPRGHSTGSRSPGAVFQIN
ncbi:MAG TPA: C39 family peptidase [Puia sp.]|nr:C39 family peptidase [Puia sp.]